MSKQPKEKISPKAYAYQREQVFAMIDPAYQLRVSVMRDAYDDGAGKLNATSAVYFFLERSKPDASGHTGTIARLQWWQSQWSEENEYSGAQRLDLVKQSHDIRLRLPNGGQLEEIRASERDALLALLKELRGLTIHYTADLFGFLRKDGSDTPVDIALPFPELVQDKAT